MVDSVNSALATTYPAAFNAQAKYAETFGLHVVAYEGGWVSGMWLLSPGYLCPVWRIPEPPGST